MLKKLRHEGPRAGFRRTPQRLAILRFLEGNTTHPSAEEVFRKVSRKSPSLSVATVYNTLNTLARTGAIREITVDPERKRYDPVTSDHHHAICLQCKRIIDIMEDVPVAVPHGLAEGFTVTGTNIVFSGTCRSCSRTQESGSGG